MGETKKKAAGSGELTREQLRRKKKKQAAARRRLLLIWFIFIALLVAFAVVFMKHMSDSDGEILVQKSSYEINSNEGVTTLINDYLTAICAVDQQTLKYCVVDGTQFDDMSAVESQAQVITSYDDVTCYICEGMEEKEYVVYVTARITIAGVESQPLDIMRYYVINQSDEYLIYNIEYSDSLSTYLDEMNSKSDIQALYSEVKDDQNAKAEVDSTFREFLTRLSN